ncbi:hypothetical protein GUJ93_ZPchr0002g24113 [Zizania palustris]|uniref:Uncharacterized protein n=1 Tax=Zizania palustris TaxID=103762 RepID=A0A8J5RI38_ZIZPA|nr:hypothetical protein GUJ93_ZPchr0002g24113 [Zizania palustris]
MRTRFLATDYFVPSSSSSSRGLSLEAFSFPSLPLPALPLDPQFPHFLPFIVVAELPATGIAGDGLNSLPIASALSEFLEAVIPQALTVPTMPAADEVGHLSLRVLDDFLYDRGGNGEGFSSRESGEGLGVITIEKDEKEERSISDGSVTSTVTKRCELLKELRFEVVEVDLLTDLPGDVASFRDEESGGGVTLSFRVPDMKIHLDFIDTAAEITIRYPSDLAESVYQVEKNPIGHNDGDDHSSVGDSFCLAIAALDHGVPIPQLEVSRNSWELDDCLTETDRSNVFHNVVSHLDESHVQHTVFKSTEFLRSTNMDTLSFVCDDVPCLPFQVDKPTTVKDAVEMDLVRINDNILLEINSALYPLKPDGTCSDLPCSVLLEEIQIIDFPLDDVFKMLVHSEAAMMNRSDEIFKDDFDTARHLYESMVSSELLLVDNTFKSLPTPILNDDMTESSYWRHSFSDGQGISKQKLLELITGECSEGSYDHSQRKSEKELLESHPSLSDIEAILRSNKQTGQKILIVADRAFWLPLGQKLTSMNMTFVEHEKNSSATYLDLVNKVNSTTWILEELLKSDCILLDNKIIAGFQFILDKVLHTLQKDLQEKVNKMRLVDSLNFIPARNQPQGLQEKLSNHLPSDSTKDLLPHDQLHRVGNLDKKNIFDLHNSVPADEQLHIQETLRKRHVVNSQHCVSTVEKSSSTSSVSANVLRVPHDNQSATDLTYCVKNDSIMPGRISAPKVVIVVNTGNHGKNMLFSRRSSYQQILALEKGGIQVVERDIDMPVDLILSAAVCLVWYETRIVESNEVTSSAEISGIITHFVENIATNILMSVSFTFTDCIMVFEGEGHFLSAVMDSSDSLYAAAASLDMNLQLFFSYTPKSTDEIILNCIRKVAKLIKAPSPDIPESESLAESFLTRFPSINPLSAYMILSSGGSLAEFLSWPHERRIQSVGRHLLSPQIISLFNALCKFGELGESRSVMTECSSVDSEHAKVFSPAKLRKFSDMENTIPEPPQVCTVHQCLNRGGEGFPFYYQQSKRDVDAITANQVSNYDFSNGFIPNIRAYNGRAGSMVNTFNLSWQPELGGKHLRKSPFLTNRPSFSRNHSLPVFPSALEINDEPGEWNISGGTNQTWKGHAHGDIAEDSYRNDMGSKYREPSDENVQHQASSLAFLKQDFGSNATSQGSSWEIDYLRQMNEKRRARQGRSRCNDSEATWNPRMRDGDSKILSPPPIESFRYRGDRDTPSRDRNPSIGTQHYGKGREGTKAHNRRVRKDFKVQPIISNEKRIEPSIDPTWTPIDKRARQKLSFVTYGKEKQSKLVWRNKNSPGVGCGFRKRYREEAGRFAVECLVSRGDLPPQVLQSRSFASTSRHRYYARSTKPHS